VVSTARDRAGWPAPSKQQIKDLDDPFLPSGMDIVHRTCGGRLGITFDALINDKLWKCFGCSQSWVYTMPWTASQQYVSNEFAVQPPEWGAEQVYRLYFDELDGCYKTRPLTPEEMKLYVKRHGK
jgi:hypothetical protein